MIRESLVKSVECSSSTVSSCVSCVLQQVRELSRKQFMCRMLIRKCRQTAGLPEMTT